MVAPPISGCKTVTWSADVENAQLLETIEIFAARICHDLVGPVGAIANGVELLADDGGRADPEVVQLIASSARSASRRLQYFRTAFGSGNALSETRSLGDARALAVALLEDGKVRLDWPVPGPEIEAAGGRKVAKLLLNLILVASEALPRGGTIRIAPDLGAAGLRLELLADGTQARLPEEHRQAFSPAGQGGPSARAIPAWIARLAADSVDARIETEEGDNLVRFAVLLPRR
jgi:histidine phosphotransferase ChpT